MTTSYKSKESLLISSSCKRDKVTNTVKEAKPNEIIYLQVSYNDSIRFKIVYFHVSLLVCKEYISKVDY